MIYDDVTYCFFQYIILINQIYMFKGDSSFVEETGKDMRVV